MKIRHDDWTKLKFVILARVRGRQEFPKRANQNRVWNPRNSIQNRSSPVIFSSKLFVAHTFVCFSSTSWKLCLQTEDPIPFHPYQSASIGKTAQHNPQTTTDAITPKRIHNSKNPDLRLCDLYVLSPIWMIMRRQGMKLVSSLKSSPYPQQSIYAIPTHFLSKEHRGSRFPELFGSYQDHLHFQTCTIGNHDSVNTKYKLKSFFDPKRNAKVASQKVFTTIPTSQNE